MNTIGDRKISIEKKKHESQSQNIYKNLTLYKLFGLVYKNKLILTKIKNLRLNLVNPLQLPKTCFC